MASSSTDKGKQTAQNVSNDVYFTVSFLSSHNGPQDDGGQQQEAVAEYFTVEFLSSNNGPEDDGRQQEAVAGSSSMAGNNRTPLLLPTRPREPSSSHSTPATSQGGGDGGGAKRKLDAMMASHAADPPHYAGHEIGSDEDAEHESLYDEEDAGMYYDGDAEHESVDEDDEQDPKHKSVPSPDTEHDSLYDADAVRDRLDDEDFGDEDEDESTSEEESDQGSVYEYDGDESMSDDGY